MAYEVPTHSSILCREYVGSTSVAVRHALQVRLPLKLEKTSCPAAAVFRKVLVQDMDIHGRNCAIASRTARVPIKAVILSAKAVMVISRDAVHADGNAKVAVAAAPAAAR